MRSVVDGPRFDTHAGGVRLIDELRLEERIMANLTNLQAAVTAVIAYINTLKSAPPVEDPAIQAGIDAATAELTAVLPVPAPPA